MSWIYRRKAGCLTINYLCSNYTIDFGVGDPAGYGEAEGYAFIWQK